MGLSKTQSICILLAIDTAFFLLEIIVGYAVHSLALVADAFHMFNDILSLLVGLWAVRVATSGKTSKTYTYGWQRAETLGALVNGVFLVALCVTIVLEAIQRFADPPEIQNPMLVLIVGSCGLASNILGLLLFHEHGHGHSHGGHSHDHAHEHSESAVEEGRADRHQAKKIANGSDVAQIKKASPSPQQEPISIPGVPGENQSMGTSYKRGSLSRSRRRDSAPRFMADEIPASAHGIRQSLIQQGNLGTEQIPEDTVEPEGRTAESRHDATETSPLLTPSPSRDNDAAHSHSHDDHDHSHAKESKKGGHSHGDLNMRGVLLHVIGDALGNVGVILSALFIWKTSFSWRFYADPLISLIITVIILASAIPLCRATSRILLQGVPPGINVDAIKADIEELEHVVSCHHLHVWQLSDKKLVASLHIQIEFKPDSSDLEVESKNKMSEAQGGILMNHKARTLYMNLAKDIHQLLHEYGIDSSTIQPEFCTDTTHRHLVSRGSNGEATLVGETIDAQGNAAVVIVDPAETCLLECDASCGNSVSGQCCEPAPTSATGNGAQASSSAAGSPPTDHVH